MRTLYNFSIQLYYLAISIASSIGNKKAKLWLHGRIAWKDKLTDLPKGNELIWIHAASLGEFEQARPLIEKFKKQQAHYYILLSFFSPSGFEVQKNYALADKVIYLPLDTTKNAMEFINLAQPKLVVFIKYEFWFNYLNQLRKLNIKTVLVSGIFRKKQHFFKFYGGWFRKQLESFNHFYLQNENSQTLLESIGYQNSNVVGDTRFDRVLRISQEPFEDKRFDTFSKEQKVLVFGSSWKEENELAVELSKERSYIKIIVAPHQIDAAKMAQLKKQFTQAILLSETTMDQDLSEFQLLIVDQIGLLSKLYRYADIAIIGGGFGSGIHNILEAAVYGCPVLFGPNFQKFQEAMDLIAKEGAFSSDSKIGLYNQIESLIDNSSSRKAAANRAKEYVNMQIGATDKIFQHILAH